jgi:hypothetical protein
MSTLSIMPLTLEEANKLVARWHRHHKPVPGAKFAVGVFHHDSADICGAAICGRPVSRMLDNGWKCLGERGGGKWSRPSRPRVDLHPTEQKKLWEAQA